MDLLCVEGLKEPTGVCIHRKERRSQHLRIYEQFIAFCCKPAIGLPLQDHLGSSKSCPTKLLSPKLTQLLEPAPTLQVLWAVWVSLWMTHRH